MSRHKRVRSTRQTPAIVYQMDLNSNFFRFVRPEQEGDRLFGQAIQ